MIKQRQSMPFIISWLGPLLILFGIGAGIAIGQWGALSFTFLSLGILVTLIQILVVVTRRQFWQQRSTQVGTNTIVATVAVIVILTLINVFATRHNTQFDLTEQQIYTLSPQSQQVIQQLETPVKLLIFDDDASTTTLSTLENYRRLSQGLFSYELIDPRDRPGLAEEFEVRFRGEVHLEANGQKQLLQTLQQEPISESRLTNALARLSNNQEDTVYFLQGHGEYQLGQISQAIERLEERGYLSNPLNIAERLAQGEPSIPDDASVIVIANPQQTFFESEIEAVQTYLERGGGVLLLLEPFQEPALEPLLQEWGILLDDRLVIDGAGGMLGIDAATGGVVGYGPIAPLITQYGSHPITADFGNSNSFYPLARAIIEESVPEGVESTSLLLTNNQSWAESDVEGPPSFDGGLDLPGPLTLGVALTRSLPGETGLDGESEETPSSSLTTGKDPRFVVIGSSQFFIDGLFEQQLNGDVFVNSVVWLSQRDGEILSISPKDPTNRRIEMGAAQLRLVYLLAFPLLPLFGVLMSVMIWWQRR